jgi:hypothetical protein
MSAAGQSPAPDPMPSTALQARLNHLFRHHLRDDPAQAATGILRRYVENYRTAAQAEHRP